MEIVHALADGIGSRPAGTQAERNAASFLQDQFEGMGYAVDVVPFTIPSGRSQNVIAYDPNESSTAPLVVIGGHYDTVPAGPGANDNGSGTATTVEVARQLAASPVPGVAVRFVAFGSEEIGLFGSKSFVSRLTPADRQRLKVAISIDMMAVGAQPAFGGSEPWLSEALARAASQGWQPEELSGYLRRLSDHASFLDAGLPAIMFHWVDDPYYHTALDISANVQPYSMDLMGAIAIGLVQVAAG
jgi:Zn-dependent M28 family amino/carboxypeptidase